MGLNNINRATERIGARSISTAGFSLMEGGRASMRFLVDEIIMEYAANDLLGGAVPLGNGIQRNLPAAHPQYPWLFCERISSIEGLKFKVKYDSSDAIIDAQLEADAIAYYARYEKYEILADFTTRPYAVLKDSSIPQQQFSYYDDAGAVVANKGYAEEWKRFTEIIYKPAAEYLTAVAGQLAWKMNANPGVLVWQNKPVLGGQLRQLVRSVNIEFKWYCVPYSFVLSNNSFLSAGLGRINQTTWNGFAAGSLLFAGVNVDRVYTPPFPEFILFNGASVPSQQKICDLTLNFVLRNQAPNQAYTVTNNSHVAYGHNLVLNGGDNNWYYVENINSGLPLYPSYPFQLLFSNPDQ